MAGWARRADVIKQFIAMGRIAHLKNSSNGAEIFLVGTAHVSAKSAEEVEEVIGIVKPDIVAVELCEERAKKLLAGYHDTSLFQKVQEFMKFPGGLKQKVVHLALSASYQAMREAGLEPGKEFKVAMEEAKARRAGILLIDQRYDVTISKLTKAIRIRDVINLLGIAGADMEQIVEGLSSGNLIESIEKLKRRDAVRKLTSFMDRTFPSAVRVMLHERDEYMTRQLLTCEGKEPKAARDDYSLDLSCQKSCLDNKKYRNKYGQVATFSISSQRCRLEPRVGGLDGPDHGVTPEKLLIVGAIFRRKDSMRKSSARAACSTMLRSDSDLSELMRTGTENLAEEDLAMGLSAAKGSDLAVLGTVTLACSATTSNFDAGACANLSEPLLIFSQGFADMHTWPLQLAHSKREEMEYIQHKKVAMLLTCEKTRRRMD
ncbi:hypothetical protein SELMODRAFT_428811 [Selaginella moellendorffii]|uniref:TraB family protein n=2 Tax=Selaginella moellendorffii TaxID=88036 RepID=D8T427_SELML|nr:hypothetical protein SELMODRAFT_428811 [Selaginella moellendorffii]